MWVFRTLPRAWIQLCNKNFKHACVTHIGIIKYICSMSYITNEFKLRNLQYKLVLFKKYIYISVNG